MIGDTASGSGRGAAHAHPGQAIRGGPRTNLVIATDRRVYHVELESSRADGDGEHLLDLSARMR